ncbi:HAD-IA family hydrolase [soil metagenome]
MKKAGVTRLPHVWELLNMNSEALQVKPEVIFFDAVGTLIYLVRPAGWHYADLARRRGLSVDEHRMESAFRAAWKTQPPRETSAGPRLDDDRPWWKSLAISVLHASGDVPSGFDEDQWFDEVYLRFAEPGVWALYNDVLPCLDRWRGRSRLAVLSNFDRRLRVVLSHLEISSYFEASLLSSEVGSDKPDRAFFHHACEIMNVSPAHCLHVGDDPQRDWVGATAAGLLAFPLDRPKNSLGSLIP